MADRRVKVKLVADVSEYTAGLAKAAAQTRTLGTDVERSFSRDLAPAMRRSGERSGGLLAQGVRSGVIRNGPLIAAGVSAALAAGAPVALAGATALFGGIGAIAAAQSDEVRGAWVQLGHSIREGAIEDAAVLVPVYERMAAQIGAAFERMRPEIRDAFEASAPLIDSFTDSLTQAAENALPGLVRAVQRGGPVIEGLGSLMESIGTGISDFLDAMSDDSASAGAALESIGEALGEALPLLGELLGTGSEIAAVMLPPLVDALGLVRDVASALGPVLPAVITGLVGLKVAEKLSGPVATLAQRLAEMSYSSSALAGTAGKASTALSGMATALPLLGTVLGLYSIGLARANEQSAIWAAAVREGGEAAADARAEMSNFGAAMEATNTGWGGFIAGLAGGGATVGMTTQAIQGAREQIGLLGKAVGIAANGDLPLMGNAFALASQAARSASESWIADHQRIATSFVEPLGIYQGLLSDAEAAISNYARVAAEKTTSATDSWEDYVYDASVSLDEFALALDEQILAQENWRINLVTISQRGGAEVAQILAEMGVQGAQITADMAVATEEDFQHMRDSLIREAQLGGRGATVALDQELRVMAAIGRDGSARTIQEVARQLGLGVGVVRSIARQYGVELAAGVNPLLRGLGKPGIDISGAINSGGGRAMGGYITGPGGPTEDKAGLFALSHGEYVVKAASVAKYGKKFMDDLNVGRLATGGFVSASSVPKPPSLSPYQWPISPPGQATNERAYGDTVDWVNANTAMSPLGPGMAGTPGQYQAMFAALKSVFPNAVLTSGFRPGSITATGNLSYHALGRAVDVNPDAAMFNWIKSTYGSRIRELIFSPMNGLQVWNGRNHLYSEPTRGDHWDHIHWAMANGGVINEPVIGRGMWSGGSYSFGERGPETVLPGVRSREFSGAGGGAGGGAGAPQSITVYAQFGTETIEARTVRVATNVVGQHEYRQSITDRRKGRS